MRGWDQISRLEGSRQEQNMLAVFTSNSCAYIRYSLCLRNLKELSQTEHANGEQNTNRDSIV